MDDLHPLDLLEIDTDLPAVTQDARDRTRRWVDEEFLPRAADLWRSGTFPQEFFEALGKLGAFGTSISGWGCPGHDALTYGVLMRELERGDSGLRTSASVQGALVMTAIERFGTDAQRDQFLPAMAAGKHLGCFALSEPLHGSDPGGLTTTARKQGNHYLLAGEKMWIGNATIANTAVVWAKADDVPDAEPQSSRAIRGFLVDTALPGYQAELIEGRMSLRIGLTARINLDNVRVPESAVLPQAVGLKTALACLDQARYGIAWGSIGAAMACLDEVRQYTLQRKVFGRPLASFQLAQDKLVEMATELSSAQLLARRIAELKLAGTLRTDQISMAKYRNVEAASRIARLGRELLGAAGILDEHVCFRHLCNLESVATYEGTRDIHRLVLGRALTGLSAFR
jgi:glutaryl-CoA dehydrogenase